jgi:tRNA G18 (ribose-2'-O)-methylase SpoU
VILEPPVAQVNSVAGPEHPFARALSACVIASYDPVAMPIIPVDSIDLPELTPYRNLKDRELSALDDRFIAEGHYIVQRLIESPFPIESILAAPRLESRLAAALARRDLATPLYVAPARVVDSVVGFRFHSGCLAVARRPASPSLWSLPLDRPDVTLLVVPECNNAANLGALVRTAAGFGCSGVVLGPRSIDPFMRLAVRVSMGTVFRIPVVRSADLQADLHTLAHACDLHLVAAVCAGGVPLSSLRVPARRAVLVGAEGPGLDAPTLALCPTHATIPMSLGTDSLNVTIAAAVFLYELSREAAPQRREAAPQSGTPNASIV